MSTYELAMLVLSGITAVTLITQASMALRSIRADHERRTKQATFEYVQAIRPVWDKARFAIDEAFPGDKTVDLDAVDKSPELLVEIKKLLPLMEHLCIGVSAGVFDKDILFRMSATRIVAISTKLAPYIKHVRQSNPKAYSELTTISREFDAIIQGPVDTRGQIKHS